MRKNPYAIQPKLKPLIVQGKLSYNENVRCNNILRLKKEIREEFFDLNGNHQLMSYRMEFYRTEAELQKRINEIILAKTGLPFLLFFYGEENKAKEW